MALTPALSKALRRLRKMADRLDRDEAYFQTRHGDPDPGSVRVSSRLDAEALRSVLAHFSEEGKRQ
ncbi:MAG: hypothetical protein EOM22_12885 [Gammaproteobacteria bacterium]|nr:hypothetical protein [Gammaproteobacteria bacterium]